MNADAAGENEFIECPRIEEVGMQIATNRLRRPTYVGVDIIELSGAGSVSLTHERIR